MSVKVSVIIPSLNVVDYINKCMDSVLDQTLYELEIICIDAGSTDGTREILEDYASKDPRIVILHSAVKSYGRQVNIGLEYANGEYIAVLESDDWIEQDMYRCLYEHAAADRLDYAAADFDTFYELQSGYPYYSRQRIFSESKKNWYGEILESSQIAILRASDYVLWRGIYDRNFLIDHQIKLHESLGAAFQDMGFLQQVKTYAKRAKYIDESFYRYRQGRETASSMSLEGLRYYEREFQWLNEKNGFVRGLKGVHKKYYYFTMSISFITKYEQIFSFLDGNWKDQRLTDPYEWFKQQIMNALYAELLDEKMYGKELWESLQLLLISQKAHAEWFVNKNKDKDKDVKFFCQTIGNRPVVIFGCGKRGERLMLFCDRKQMIVDSFCDNDETLWGKEKFGFLVIPPEKLKERVYDKNGMIVLSMWRGAGQAQEQLISLGIGVDRVIHEIPEEIM